MNHFFKKMLCLRLKMPDFTLKNKHPNVKMYCTFIGIKKTKHIKGKWTYELMWISYRLIYLSLQQRARIIWIGSAMLMG